MNIKVKGEMVIIGCGGAGISIVGNLKEPLENLGSGFSNIRVEYVDTSLADINSFKGDEDNFYLIKSSGVSKEILGSGGSRRENAKDIVEGVKEFVDNKKFNKSKVSTYYVVVSSGSGGSGSVISAMLIKNLLEKNLPVISVVVGDSTITQYTKNTLGTLATLDGVAKSTKKALSVMYNDNAKGMGTGKDAKEESIDREIFRKLSALSLFLSGENKSIDQKDMVNFIEQSQSTELNIKEGLYSVDVFVKDIELPAHAHVTGIRTIGTVESGTDNNIEKLDHIKRGTTDNNNVIQLFKEQFPIHLVSYANAFTGISMELTDCIREADERSKASTVDSISNGFTADEDGLVFG